MAVSNYTFIQIIKISYITPSRLNALLDGASLLRNLIPSSPTSKANVTLLPMLSHGYRVPRGRVMITQNLNPVITNQPKTMILVILYLTTLPWLTMTILSIVSSIYQPQLASSLISIITRLLKLRIGTPNCNS